MTKAILKWTSADLLDLPENGNRYEIIDGDLFVTRAPHWRHQEVCGKLYTLLDLWSDSSRSAVPEASRRGVPVLAPGLIFSDSDNVIPDLIWISYPKLEMGVDEAGHFLIAPELVIEVLSKSNEEVDRKWPLSPVEGLKLDLYSAQNVTEYWIADWRKKQIEVYRQKDKGSALQLTETLTDSDSLSSPLLPGFVCLVSQIFK
jgi:Uma2 family endonuclease